MYKILGRMAATYPSIARTEAESRDKYWGGRVTAFKKEGQKIRQHIEIEALRRKGEAECRRIMDEMSSKIFPDYIILVFYDGVHPPRKLAERGDQNTMKMYLDEPWRRAN